MALPFACMADTKTCEAHTQHIPLWSSASCVTGVCTCKSRLHPPHLSCFRRIVARDGSGGASMPAQCHHQHQQQCLTKIKIPVMMNSNQGSC